MAILSLDNLFTRISEQQNYDIQVSSLKYTEDHYSNLNKIEAIDNIVFRYHNFEYTHNDKSLIIVGRNQSGNDISGDENLFKDLKDDEVLISEFYAIKNKYKIGDTVTIKNKMQELKFKIKGFVDISLFTSNSNAFVINQKVYKEKITTIPIEILITTDKVEEVKDSLMRNLLDENVEIITFEEFIRLQQSYVDNIVGLVRGLMFLAVSLASLGIINNQLISYMQRKKELAILYSVAMNKRQLRSMLLLESVGTFFIGCLLGGVLGIMLLPILEVCIKAIGIVYIMKVDYSALLTTLSLIFAILMLTSISPVLMVGKIDIVQEIKYE